MIACISITFYDIFLFFLVGGAVTSALIAIIFITTEALYKGDSFRTFKSDLIRHSFNINCSLVIILLMEFNIYGTLFLLFPVAVSTFKIKSAMQRNITSAKI